MSTQITHRIAWDRKKYLKLEGYVNNTSEFTSKITLNSLHPYNRRQSFNALKSGISACPHAEKVEVRLHSFLILELDGGEWLASRSRRITSGKESQNSVNRRAGLRIPVGLVSVDRLFQNVA
jgi:hypothetical protein